MAYPFLKKISTIKSYSDMLKNIALMKEMQNSDPNVIMKSAQNLDESMPKITHLMDHNDPTIITTYIDDLFKSNDNGGPVLSPTRN
jgi:hypothetical protein